jgi:hypothetical protein
MEAEMAKASKETTAEAEVEPEATTETAWWMSIPAAGRKYYGLGKWASYQVAYEVGAGDQAAEGKERLIPYIKAGRLKKALPRRIEKKLAGSNE